MVIVFEVKPEGQQRWRGRRGLQGGEGQALAGKCEDGRAWSRAVGSSTFDLNGNIEDVQASGPLCGCAVWFALMSAGSEASLTSGH